MLSVRQQPLVSRFRCRSTAKGLHGRPSAQNVDRRDRVPNPPRLEQISEDVEDVVPVVCQSEGVHYGITVDDRARYTEE